MKNNRLKLIEGTEYIKGVGSLKKKKQKWAKFNCDCGSVTEVAIYAVKNGKIKSCGCLKIEKSTKHGMSREGNRTYQSWRAMKSRCLNTKHEFYKTYSPLGICEEWKNSFESFLRDMGERPEGKSLDRINNTKGYYKQNCRWATQRQQCQNRTNNKIVTFNGDKVALFELSERYNVSITLLYNRLKRKWPIEKALLTPRTENKVRKKLPSPKCKDKSVNI
jgi:hypothetical protein